MTQTQYDIPMTDEHAGLRDALAKAGAAPFAYVSVGGVLVKASFRVTMPHNLERRASLYLGSPVSLEPFRA